MMPEPESLLGTFTFHTHVYLFIPLIYGLASFSLFEQKLLKVVKVDKLIITAVY